MTAQSIFTHRVSIVTGHYGTGKTELAVNLALALARRGPACHAGGSGISSTPTSAPGSAVPSWRRRGVSVISSSQACSDADVPALPAELLTILENRDVRGVLDIGGRPRVGARVLARFQPQDRPGGLSADLCAQRQPARRSGRRRMPSATLRSIEAITGLTCTGIVNNTHLCGETTPRPDPEGRRPGGGGVPPDGDPRPLPHGGGAVSCKLCQTCGNPCSPSP